MKRIVLAAALLMAAGAAAHAYTDHFTNLLKQPRGDDVLNADAASCREKTGQQNFNGSPMLSSYTRCMRGRGWRFDYTKVEKTWIDPDTGDTCHEILGGLGSVPGAVVGGLLLGMIESFTATMFGSLVADILQLLLVILILLVRPSGLLGQREA